MALIYIGEPGTLRINGRPMKPGDLITDPQEVADLTGQPDFKSSNPPKAKTKKASK